MNHLRNKLLYKSWNRGCKETDILLGEFARAKIDQLNTKELHALEIIVNAQDDVIYGVIAGRLPIPVEFDSKLFAEIIAFNQHRVIQK